MRRSFRFRTAHAQRPFIVLRQSICREHLNYYVGVFSRRACAEGSVAVCHTAHAQKDPKLPCDSVIRWRQCCQGVLRHAWENGRGFLWRQWQEMVQVKCFFKRVSFTVRAIFSPRYCCIYLKGTVSRDFRLLVFFSWITFPQAPEYTIMVVSNFFENSRRYSQLKVCHRCQRHRWQMQNFFNDKFLLFSLDTFGKYS
jgi:hypothetical protein